MPASRHRPPPSAGRGARDRILAAARDLYFRQGINVTGVTELCARARVSKRTLYQHFASKDEVVLAYLAEFAADPAYPPNASWPARTSRPARGSWSSTPRWPPATIRCAAARLSTRPSRWPTPLIPARRLAATYKREFADRLAALARDAGARSAERVGQRLALLYDGAAAQVTLQDSPEPASVAQALAAAVLESATD